AFLIDDRDPSHKSSQLSAISFQPDNRPWAGTVAWHYSGQRGNEETPVWLPRVAGAHASSRLSAALWHGLPTMPHAATVGLQAPRGHSTGFRRPSVGPCGT